MAPFAGPKAVKAVLMLKLYNWTMSLYYINFDICFQLPGVFIKLKCDCLKYTREKMNGM